MLQYCFMFWPFDWKACGILGFEPAPPALEGKISTIRTPAAAAAAAKLLQSCPTLCDPRDGSPQGSPVPGILQARTLEWVAISFSNAWKWEGKVKSLSCVWLLVTPWTAAHQAPLSMGFSRQEYWSGVPKTGIFFNMFLYPSEKCLIKETYNVISMNYPESMVEDTPHNPVSMKSTCIFLRLCGSQGLHP